MDQIASIILACLLIVIMLGMGLSLTPNDFKRVIKQPKAVITGLANQMLVLPLIGFVIVHLLDVGTDVAVGIMLLAACPGGTTSNIISHLAKGDTALSVSLTAFSSVIAILTIPLIVAFSLENFLAADQQIILNEVQMIAQLFVIVLLPVMVGMLIKAKAPKFAEKMDLPVGRFSIIMLVVITIGLIFKERGNITSYFLQAGTAAIMLNITTLIIGFVSALMLKLNKTEAITISIESGIQNSALAMTIATVTLQNTGFGVAPAIYTLIMYVSGFLLVYLGRRGW